MALYDKDGNEVEGSMTKEEHEAALKEASDKAVEDYKVANPAPKEETTEEKTAREAKEKEGTSELGTLTATVASLQKQIRDKDLAVLATGFAKGDTAKRDEIVKNFDKLTGFEATPEGFALQAEAAARMTGIDTTGIDVGAFSGTSSGRSVDASVGSKTTEKDAAIQKELGITAEDITKYAAPAKAAGYDITDPNAPKA